MLKAGVLMEAKPLMSHRSRFLSMLSLPAPPFLALLLLLPSAALARMSHCEAHAIHAHLSLRVSELESWEPVDSRTLLIWTPQTRRAHLIHLDRRMPSMSRAPILTLVDGDHDGSITACGHDGIQVDGERGARAVIRSMEYLSEKRTVELDRRNWIVMPIEAGLEPATQRRMGALQV